MLWPILAGLSISKTPDYYFVYPVFIAVMAGASALSRLRKKWAIWALAGTAAVFNAGRTAIIVAKLPPSQAPAALSGLKMADGAVVLGPVQDFFIFPNATNISPLAIEDIHDTAQALALLDAMAPDVVVILEPDEKSLLKRFATSRGLPVAKLSYRGYAKTREGLVPISGVELFGLGPGKSSGPRPGPLSRPEAPSRQRQNPEQPNPQP